MNTTPANGRPAQFVLRTADASGAIPFYSGLLGWASTSEGAFSVKSQPVAHIESGAGGWLPFIAVDDLDAAIAATLKHDGTVKIPATESEEHGRRAVILDPTGAAIGFWEIASSSRVEAGGHNGGIVWLEEKTRDRVAASAFLSELFAFEFFGPERRGVARPFRGTGQLWGGVMEFDDRWAADYPPHWLIYVWVEDVQQSADRAVELGGSVWFPPVDTPLGQLAYLRDKEGNAFAVVAVSEPGLAMIRS